MIVAKVDMSKPGEGLILLTGDHGFPKEPMARLKRHGPGNRGAWTLHDHYGDPDRDGRTARRDFYTPTARSIKVAVERWAKHLGIDPTDIEIKKSRMY